MDFCKAFDCVPHKCVLFKLKAYGNSGNVLNWIMDFLSNSQQGVNVNGSCSDRSNNISGVPQRSVLGPLLFIIYIPEVVQSNIAIFADDTKLLIPLTIVVATVQSDLDLLVEWCRVWQMKFNFVNI